MGMEPFDYLTYKRNKQKVKKTESLSKKEKMIVSGTCIGTFVVFFVFVMGFIASKSSKIDIEYGRLGENPNTPIETQNSENGEEMPVREKYTIDKRLFLIQQEEHGPSESKVVEKAAEQSEVISKDQFKEIKTNNEEVVQKAEKQVLAKKPQETQTENPIKPDIDTTKNIVVGENKIAIKPKLPVKPQTTATQPAKQLVTTAGALDLQLAPSKVLVGKFSTFEEARTAQEKVPEIPGASPFIKKLNGYYTVQVGAYASFDMAKVIAGKLKSKGLDVWIYQ